jgi:hypothetical protein
MSYVVIDVRDFGAVGDGVVDDSDALEAAVAAAKKYGAQSDYAGKPMYLPKGTYRITRPLKVEDVFRFTLRGDGPGVSGIVYDGATEGAAILDLRSAWSLLVERLSFSTSATATVTRGVWWHADSGTVSRAEFRDLIVSGRFVEAGVRIGSDATGTQCDQAVLERVVVEGGRKVGAPSGEDDAFWRNGIYFGGTVVANNLNHAARDSTIIMCQVGMRFSGPPVDVGGMTSMQTCETDFWIGAGKVHIGGVTRSEVACWGVKTPTGPGPTSFAWTVDRYLFLQSTVTPALWADAGVTSSTTTSLTDATQAWAPEAHIGRIVRFNTGDAADEWRVITDNTATTLYWSTPLSPAPAAGTGYVIQSAVTSATATTLTLADAGWATDALKGYAVVLASGKGDGQYRKVLGNTADTLTVAAWDTGGTPDATTAFAVGVWPEDGAVVRTEEGGQFAIRDLQVIGTVYRTTGRKLPALQLAASVAADFQISGLQVEDLTLGEAVAVAGPVSATVQGYTRTLGGTVAVGSVAGVTLLGPAPRVAFGADADAVVLERVGAGQLRITGAVDITGALSNDGGYRELSTGTYGVSTDRVIGIHAGGHYGFPLSTDCRAGQRIVVRDLDGATPTSFNGIAVGDDALVLGDGDPVFDPDFLVCTTPGGGWEGFTDGAGTWYLTAFG